MDVRALGRPGAGSGWSGVSGRVQRPLITSSRGGGDAFRCCRRYSDRIQLFTFGPRVALVMDPAVINHADRLPNTSNF